MFRSIEKYKCEADRPLAIISRATNRIMISGPHTKAVVSDGCSRTNLKSEVTTPTRPRQLEPP